MTLTAEQSRALVDAIATAPSSVALADLRLEARRAGLFDVGGGFVEVLMGLREYRLSQLAVGEPDGRAANVQTRSPGQLPASLLTRPPQIA